MLLKPRVEPLENPKAVLVEGVHLSQQREVVRGELPEYIVFDQDQLQLLHVEALVHLHRAFVHHVNQAGLSHQRMVVEIQLLLLY